MRDTGSADRDRVHYACSLHKWWTMPLPISFASTPELVLRFWYRLMSLSNAGKSFTQHVFLLLTTLPSECPSREIWSSGKLAPDSSISWRDSLWCLCWVWKKLCWVQNFALYRLVLFSTGVIGQKILKIQKKLIFFEKSEKYFLARFAILTVLALKKVVLSSALNSASTGVKIIGGHRAKNISPKWGCGRLLRLVGWVGEKFCPMTHYNFDTSRRRI